MRKIFSVFIIFILEICFLYSSDKFIFTQLKYNGNWDPYPYVYIDVLELISITTSIKVEKERKVVDLNSNSLKEDLASKPFVILLGDDEIKIPYENILVLRDYVICGGTIFIEDTSELYYSKFDTSIREILKIMFPEHRLKKTTINSVLMRSFYLIRSVNGRVAMFNYLEYIEYEGRPAVIYSRNNIISCWARDRFGKFIHSCIPAGEQQRFNAQKLFLNIIIYSLCGTYKLDKVHQPFIEEKLKR